MLQNADVERDYRVHQEGRSTKPRVRLLFTCILAICVSYADAVRASRYTRPMQTVWSVPRDLDGHVLPHPCRLCR